jgi:acyl carrier protein
MIDSTLQELMSTILGVSSELIGPGASTDNLPTWDSLAHMNLVIALEEEFGISIPDDEAANITSYELVRISVLELVGGTDAVATGPLR